MVHSIFIFCNTIPVTNHLRYCLCADDPPLQSQAAPITRPAELDFGRLKWRKSAEHQETAQAYELWLPEPPVQSKNGVGTLHYPSEKKEGK